MADSNSKAGKHATVEDEPSVSPEAPAAAVVSQKTSERVVPVAAAEKKDHSPLDSTFPMFLPHDPALTYPEESFNQELRGLAKEIAGNRQKALDAEFQTKLETHVFRVYEEEELMKTERKDGGLLFKVKDKDHYIMVPRVGKVTHDYSMIRYSSEESAAEDAAETDEPTTKRAKTAEDQGDAWEAVGDSSNKVESDKSNAEESKDPAADVQHPFMKAVLTEPSKEAEPTLDFENKMLTENADVAFKSTGSALTDLFSSLNAYTDSGEVEQLLTVCWQGDPAATLKLIFNSRSIHLGKSDRKSFYRCMLWLAVHHPLTYLHNLKWIGRSTIELKPAEKKEGEEADEVEMIEMVEGQDIKDARDSDFDVERGGSHGYFKDVLNLLAFQAENMNMHSNFDEVLCKGDGVEKKRTRVQMRGGAKPKQRLEKVVNKIEAKERRHKMEATNRAKLIKRLEDPLYRATHLTVARLFADQLKTDLEHVQSGDKARLLKVSLAAKWAPSLEKMHDKYTLAATSIAEILHPEGSFKQKFPDRATYLKHARDAYRRDTLSPLRAALDVVERKICADRFSEINYSRVPSLAMKMYMKLFATKDEKHFDQYLDEVASGKRTITGAVLTPSGLVKQALELSRMRDVPNPSMKQRVDLKIAQTTEKVINGQWNSLVQRIVDSGTLKSAMAVSDVSGSMEHPTHADGTTPMHSSIALGLLLAEVVAEPFGGAIITFDSYPSIYNINLTKTFTEKVAHLAKAPWGGSTDLVGTFTRLILPRALEHKVKPEDMVKTVFVFSDMQFNAADGDRTMSFYNREKKEDDGRWSTSYERIQKAYKDAGYEMPQLVYWNLAGHTAYGGMGETNPKPVEKDTPGTAIVTGYSQAMLKVFMEGGDFEDVEEKDEDVEMVEDGDEEGDEAVEVKKKNKLTPESVMRKAISHRAYQMLKVYD